MAENTKYTSIAQPKILSAEVVEGTKPASEMSLAFVCALAPALMAASLPLMMAGCFTVSAVAACIVAGVIAATAFSVFGRLVPAARPKLLPIMLIVVVACGVGILLIPDARSGFFAFVNAIIAGYNETFSSYQPLLASGSIVCGSVLFAVLLGIVVGTLCWFFTRLRWSCASLLAVVVVAGVTLRFSLGYAAAAVLGVSAWLIQCRFTQLKNSSYTTALLAGVASGLLTLCFCAFGLCMLLYSPAPAVDDVFHAVQTAQRNARYGSDSLPQGNLQLAPAMNDGDSDCLTIGVNGRVSDDLLLRGFVGANFDGKKWDALDYSAYEGEWKGATDWMAGKGVVPVEQRAAFNDENTASGDGKSYDITTLDIDASNANARWHYMPYTMRSIETGCGLNLDGVVVSGVFGEHSYRITMDNVPTSDMLADASWLDGSQSDYAQAEAVYASFANKNYLDISDEEAEAVREYIFNPDTWDEQAATSEYSVISRVRTMLDTLASYSENVAAPAEDEPFTEWFLGQQRQGNSAYFATVAALAFREQGIPARYVEGYRASMEDVSYANAAGQSLELGAHDAHAWVEVYLEGLGWTPVEVTPGFYTQSLNVDSVIDVGEALSNGSQDVAMQGESVAGQMDENEQTPNIALPVLPILASVVLIVLGLAAVLVVALFEQRIYRRRHTKKQIADEDQSICVPVLYRNLSVIMKAGSLDFDRERPLDCIDRFERTFKGIDAQEYHRVIELHQAYAFGGHELKPNELRTLRRFNERLYAALPEATSVVERAKRYFIDAL